MLHVVIVNYNSAEYVRQCVDSIDVEARIHLVDNGSPHPGESALLTELAQNDSRVELTLLPVNIGFGAAANLGAQTADPRADDAVWILNPDTVLRPGAAANLLAFLALRPRTIVSPVITTGEADDSFWFAGGSLKLRSGESQHFTTPRSTAPYAVSFLTGAAVMTMGSTWSELGGFREDLFLYWEDADLSLRATASGIDLYVVPAARIWHRVGASSAEQAVKSLTWYYYIARNRVVICARTPTDAVLLVLVRGLLPTLNHVYRAAKEPGAFLPRVKAMARGTAKGIGILKRGVTTETRAD